MADCFCFTNPSCFLFLLRKPFRFFVWPFAKRQNMYQWQVQPKVFILNPKCIFLKLHVPHLGWLEKMLIWAHSYMLKCLYELHLSCLHQLHVIHKWAPIIWALHHSCELSSISYKVKFIIKQNTIMWPTWYNCNPNQANKMTLPHIQKTEGITLTTH